MTVWTLVLQLPGKIKKKRAALNGASVGQQVEVARGVRIEGEDYKVILEKQP